MYKKLTVSIVIPAYNEQKLIKDTILGVPKYVDKIIVVDDGSTDKTASIVKELKRKNRKIELIQHKVNKGLGSAIVTGYKKSIRGGYDAAVVVGGDNQMDLKELPTFLEPIVNDEADYVKGNRFLNKSYKIMPFARLLGNIMLSITEKPATGYWKIFDTHDGYTVINKKALEHVDWDSAWKGYAYNVDFLARLNIAKMRVKDVPRRAIYLPGERQSQIKILRYIIMAMPLIIRTFLWRIKEKYLKW